MNSRWIPWAFLGFAVVVVFVASGDLSTPEIGTRLIAIAIAAAVVSALQAHRE